MEYFFDAKQLATWKTFLMKEGTTWALNIVAMRALAKKAHMRRATHSAACAPHVFM